MLIEKPFKSIKNLTHKRQIKQMAINAVKNSMPQNRRSRSQTNDEKSARPAFELLPFFISQCPPKVSRFNSPHLVHREGGRTDPGANALPREGAASSWPCFVSNGRRVTSTETTATPKSAMVLQVLDLVGANGEPFYGDCPLQTYTDLDVNSTGHITCTVVPQGSVAGSFCIRHACKFRSVIASMSACVRMEAVTAKFE